MAVTVACLNAGNYLGMGRTYVLNLFRGVTKNLTVPFRFVCFTDDLESYAEPIDVRPLPHDGAKAWYCKLSLFKSDVFKSGERVLYLDLDSVITGALGDIASYPGEFAMIEDLMFPQLRASGVMAWCGGFGAHIWESYVAAGLPINVRFAGCTHGGDGAWIMDEVPRADVLQDLYPNQIASYKMSAGVLAPQTRICAFHGTPRPHEITSGWVPALWRGLPLGKENIA